MRYNSRQGLRQKDCETQEARVACNIASDSVKDASMMLCMTRSQNIEIELKRALGIALNESSMGKRQGF